MKRSVDEKPAFQEEKYGESDAVLVMRRGWIGFGVFLTVFAVMGCRDRGISPPPKAQVLREDGEIEVLAATFNIRNENNGDSADRAWPSRVSRAVRLIRKIDPDILGLQELTHGQAADLRASLPDFDFVGVAREDGKRKGEYAGIFYKTTRFVRDMSEGGTFWLSATPDKPGSITWGNSFSRVTTWTRLVDLATGRGLYVYNTHFDHRHQGSREEAAVLIGNRIDARKHADEPVLLLGDFNAVETNPAVAYLAGKPGPVAGVERQWKNGLIDTFRVAHPSGTSPRTLHLWGRANSGWKVDHILASKRVKVVRSEVIADAEPFSSDHFPVTARVVFP